MATPQLSPGVLVREIDLTVGRPDNVLDNIGAIAAPFKSGPIEEAVSITNQSQLLEIFGRPQDSADIMRIGWLHLNSLIWRHSPGRKLMDQILLMPMLAQLQDSPQILKSKTMMIMRNLIHQVLVTGSMLQENQVKSITI